MNKLNLKIPRIKEDVNYWLVKTSNGKFYQQFINHNQITLYNFPNVQLTQVDELRTQLGNKKFHPIKQFIEDIKIDDIIIIPSHLKKQLSIGVVKSNCDHDYLTRDMLWLKEIHFSELDPKCHKFFFKEESLIDLNEVASYLERLIYNLYVKSDKYYFSIKINQKSNILFKSIYGLYCLFLNDHPDDHLEIKINLQSPGIIEFISKNLEVIIVIIKAVQIISSIKNRKEDELDQELIDKYYKYEIDKLEIDTPELNYNFEDK